MAKYFVEAYDGDDCQILGNLDGQGVIRCQNYTRSALYRNLMRGVWPNGNVISRRVKGWQVVRENSKCGYTTVSNCIFNPYYEETSK